MNAKETIALTYLDLGEGETRAGEHCPACGGGESKERSLSVARREGKLLYKCHRASCGLKGGVNVGADHGHYPSTEAVSNKGAVGRYIGRLAGTVDEPTAQMLWAKYHLTDDHIRRGEIGLDPDTGALVLPVKSFSGDWLGVNLKGITQFQKRAKLFAEDNALSWHVNHTAPDIIVVEDQLSAIRSSVYLTSVALLGTHLNIERAVEIKKHSKGRVFLALDADAWNKTVEYVAEFRWLLDLIPIKLGKDLKNLNEQELKEFINEEVIHPSS